MGLLDDDDIMTATASALRPGIGAYSTTGATSPSALPPIKVCGSTDSYNNASGHHAQVCGAQVQVLAAASPAHYRHQDMQVHTFGFGTEHNERLLKRVADAGSGTYYFVRGALNIAEVFADALGGLLSLCAQGIEIIVTPLHGCTVKALHTGFSKRTYVGTGGVEVTHVAMPDLYADEVKDLVIEVTVPPAGFATAASDNTLDIVDVAVFYKDVLRGLDATTNIKVTINRTPDPPRFALPNPAVTAHTARFDTVTRMHAATTLADAGDYAAATTMLDEQAHEIEQLMVSEAMTTASDATWSEPTSRTASQAPRSNDMLSALHADLSNLSRASRRNDSWTTAGRKMAVSSTTSHGVQRSTGLASLPAFAADGDPRGSRAAAALSAGAGAARPLTQLPRYSNTDNVAWPMSTDPGNPWGAGALGGHSRTVPAVNTYSTASQSRIVQKSRLASHPIAEADIEREDGSSDEAALPRAVDDGPVHKSPRRLARARA